MAALTFFTTTVLVASVLFTASSQGTDDALTTFLKDVNVIGDSLVPGDDALMGQMATEGGNIWTEGADTFLSMKGVGSSGIAIADPTDPSSLRLVTHAAIASALPRFSVLMTNHSQHPITSEDAIPFTSLILIDLVDVWNGTLKFKVDILGGDAHNWFPGGLLLTDLTPNGHAMTDDKSEVLQAEDDKSLRWLMANTDGFAIGAVPQSMNGTEVRAQGVFSTAFLGPFNAWAWICCGYKIATAWTVIFPWSWIFWPICCA